MSLVKKLFVFLCLCNTTGLVAQPEQYKFKHLDVNDGLSQNQVITFLKDSKGFVWIGTMSGLNRYDGHTIKAFLNNAQDSTSLHNNYINRLFEVPDGRIGVLTTGGLALYDPIRESFQRNLSDFYRQYQIFNADILDVQRGIDHNYWFVLSNGLLMHDRQTNSNYRIFHRQGDTTSIVADTVTSFSCDKAGRNWLIHRNGILENVTVDTAGGRVVYRNDYLYRRNHGLDFDYRIVADADGDVWVYVANDNQGVYFFSTREKTFHVYNSKSPDIRLNTDIIGGLVQDNKGLIWVGTDHGGINLIDKKKRTVTYLYHRDEGEKSLSQNSISTLYRDDQGTIWIGTYKRGVSYYHESIFQFPVYKHYTLDPSSLPYGDVNRFVEDEAGNLWIGTNGGGLIYFERKTGRFKQYKNNPNDPFSLSSDVIVSLCIDHEKKLWIGTYYGGLNVFDGKRFTRYNYDPFDSKSLSGRSVWEIYEDSKNNLWIGTLEGGVNIFNRVENSFKRLKVGGENAIQSTYIASIMEDSRGNMWFGTGNGIDVLSAETGKFKHYGADANANALNDPGILDMKEDSKGRIWIATMRGLNVFDPESNTFKSFTEKHRLPHNTILTILEDNNHAIWLSSPAGLSQLIFSNDTLKNAEVRNYTEDDGLQGKQFNENAAYKTNGGELIFGGPNGFNIFNPNTLTSDELNLKVVFVDFQLFQESVGIGESIDGRVILPRSITETKNIILPPGQNFFSVEFTSLNYFHPEKTEFRYKLDGLHTDWLPADKNSRKISFTGINPGDYTLRVKAFNNGQAMSDETVLAISILPPFWKTRTAFILYLFILIVILYLARKLIQQREKMKFVIEQERREAMRMHELDMMKIRFFTNVSHEFRTPLTLILTPLERLIRDTDRPDQLTHFQLIQRNAKRLLNLVNQLLDFRKMEVQEIRFTSSEGDIVQFIREAVYSFSDLAEKKNIQLTFESTAAILETIFDQDKLEKILFNLLSNAFKFTPEHGRVSVAVSLQNEGDDKLLRIDVADTGIGIPADKLENVFDRFFQHDLPDTVVNQGSGIGLSITREFVKIHHGSISVESEVGKGSCFTVILPIKDVFHEKHADVSEQINKSSGEAEVPEQPLMSESSSAMPVLLLVEDNDDFRFYLKDNLKLRFRIMEARNGQEALKLVLSNPPDLIVSDIMMPVMNGLDFCKKVKEDERISHIPVILLTARTSEEQKLEGFEKGADEYLTKPFNFEILESRIRGLIALRQKLHTVVGKRINVKASELDITPLDTRFIENAIKCVEKNISSTDFSVEHLGRELGISRAYLYKKVVALTGKSPLEFIRSIRMQHAAQLLEKSQLTVAEVAYQVGFNNPKYFARYFKEEFSMLPSQYANKKK